MKNNELIQENKFLLLSDGEMAIYESKNCPVIVTGIFEKQ